MTNKLKREIPDDERRMRNEHEWWLTPEKVAWVQIVLNSFRHWTNRELIERGGSPEEQARAVFEAPYVVVSHGAEADPILNYGNRIALDLWMMDWGEFSRTPSRCTAEPMDQGERQRMLEEAATRGYYSAYRGVRVSKTGRRFLVEDAIVWNLMAEGHRCGQAASFSKWTLL
jgi:hypothetical protein